MDRLVPSETLLVRAAIVFAKRIAASKRYKNTKLLFKNLLENPDYPLKKYFDLFMIVLILSSIAILVYEVRRPLPDWIVFYDVYAVTAIFLLEYLLRLWVHDDIHTRILKAYERSKFLSKPFKLREPLLEALKVKMRLMATPAMIVDLLAILPAYRPLRVLRIFVLFRIFKLLRYTKSINQFVDVLKTKRFELYTLLFLLLFIVSAAGIALYVFEEKHNPNITSLFDAFYWALVTISTVGYGDISPVTVQGRAVSIVIIISGIAMISFVTSVIVSAFSEKLDELKQKRIIEEINRSERFLIICGYGPMSKMFLQQCKENTIKYVILEKDPRLAQNAVEEGFVAINEDASRYEVLSRFNVKYSEITVLALTPSDIENIYIALNAKSISSKIKVIARANDEAMHRKFHLAGVEYVLFPNQVTSQMLLTAITKPVMYHGLHALLTGHNVAYMDEVHLEKVPKLVGLSVQETDFERFKLLFIGLQRQGEFIFNPEIDFVFEKGDILLLMGLKISIDYFKEHFSERFL